MNVVPKLRVIDVSNNNPISLHDLQASHASALICKATEGTTFRDATFSNHRAIAAQAKVPFGSYLFLHALDRGNEAEFYLSYARPRVGDIQPIVDAETGGLDGASVETMAHRTLSCLAALGDHGYEPLWYSNLAFAEGMLHYEPRLANYRLWQAQYAAQRSPVGHNVSVVMWQYTETYKVNVHRYDASLLFVPVKDVLIPRGFRR